MKNTKAIFKTEILIYKSKANLDVTNLIAKITHHSDIDIRKMLTRSSYGKENSKVDSGPIFTYY